MCLKVGQVGRLYEYEAKEYTNCQIKEIKFSSSPAELLSEPFENSVLT